jgi:ribosomal protein S18 acetylase RimI-like enzyme
MGSTVRQLGDADLGALVDHLCRNALESGRDGDAYARPRPLADQPDPLLLARELAKAWLTPVGVPGWERHFGAFDGATLVGHLDLRGGLLGSEQHRATLGIGLQRPWRRRGLGRRLCDAAIAWARVQQLAWIDLGVFADNAGAIALYRELGFEQLSVHVDRFRVDGRSLDDVTMTLRL